MGKETQEILLLFDHELSNSSPICCGYEQQRNQINQLFKIYHERHDLDSIMVALTVIGSLYSTNATYSYFSIEDLATSLFEIGKREELGNYFYGLVEKKHLDERKLFSRCFGSLTRVLRKPTNTV